MIARIVLAAALVAAAPAAAADEPTLDQLLATPSASDIVAQWKAVCLDHADDATAQQAAVKASGITWPYQVYFMKDKRAPACVVASTIAASDTLDGLFDAVEASAAPAVLTDRKAGADHVSASTVIGDLRYEVTASIKEAPGTHVGTVMLTSLKDKK